MKNNYLRMLCAAALLLPMLWSCQREAIADDAGAAPSVSGLTLDPPCSSPKTIGLADGSGSTLVNLCVSGGVPGPCVTTIPWGSIDYYKYTTSAYPNSFLGLEVHLAPGWVSNGYNVIVTPPGPIQTSGNLPVVTPSWTNGVLNPYYNSFLVDEPLLASLYQNSCFEWAIAINAFRLTLNGFPITGSERTLYAYDPNGAGSPFVIDDCYEGCPLPDVTETQGTSQGCRAAVTVTNSACASVSISSTRPIKQVVIVYDDCTREYHDNLNVNSVSYSAPASGKVISHVFVRSGCRANTGPASQDNVDTNGNNYPNVRRFQFNGPCLNASCL